MTDEELDKARAEEAYHLWLKQRESHPTAAMHAARLARQGWKPANLLRHEERIAELETDNERLREALEHLKKMPTYIRKQDIFKELNKITKAGLGEQQ